MTILDNTNANRISAIAAGTIKLLRRGTAKITVVFVLALAVVSGFSQGAPLKKAASVIEDADNAKTIFNFLHFASTYNGYKYLETDSVTNGDGQTLSDQSALVYRFYCTDGDNTDVVFFVNQSGQIYKTKIRHSTGFPFVAANLSIQLIGHLVTGSDDKMTAEQKQQVNELIEKADAHGLMDFWLAVETM
ncbi:MAG TPA: hypothetical protein VL346_08735 [Acidobacteriaceae bacterium]|nr:hypothetical protein [Acidobacteriaceae bacterium]